MCFTRFYKNLRKTKVCSESVKGKIGIAQGSRDPRDAHLDHSRYIYDISQWIVRNVSLVLQMGLHPVAWLSLKSIKNFLKPRKECSRLRNQISHLLDALLTLNWSVC